VINRASGDIRYEGVLTGFDVQRNVALNENIGGISAARRRRRRSAVCHRLVSSIKTKRGVARGLAILRISGESNIGSSAAKIK